jgi:DUF1009 family protein
MARAGSEVVGLVAGQGRFPLDIANSAERSGRRVVAVAFHGQTDLRIETAVSEVTWLHPGEVGAAIDALRSAGVRDAVMAGKVSKTALSASPETLLLDSEASAILSGLADRGDDSLLGALADHLESRGIHLLEQAELVPELLAGRGVLGRTRPVPAQWEQLAFAWPLAKAVARLDIGQTLVVKDGSVLAVEAIEGTDAAIHRGGALAAGACVVKVARPDQDLRFDLPTVGPETLKALVAARASLLAIEAGKTVVLEREALVREADRHSIALVGVTDGDFEGAG